MMMRSLFPFSFAGRKTLAFLMLIAPFVLGCLPETRLDPDLPATEVDSVRLETTQILGPETLGIIRVDGEEPKLFEHKWVLKPGAHEVEIEARLENYHSSSKQTTVTKVVRTLDADFEAGGEYRAHATKQGDTIFIWIDDANSGALLAGEAPASAGNGARQEPRR